MNPVVLPRGVVDLGRDMPPRDVHLVAPTGSLVARESTHGADPALRAGGGAGAQRRAGGSNTRASSRTRAPKRPLAARGRPLYRNGVPLLRSVTCRSGWPTCSSACGRCARDHRRGAAAAVADAAAAVRVPSARGSSTLSNASCARRGRRGHARPAQLGGAAWTSSSAASSVSPCRWPTPTGCTRCVSHRHGA